MTILDNPVPHPLPLVVLRALLLNTSTVTAVVSTRISDRMPTSTPRFPALRLTEITSTEPHGVSRTLVQIDCWADTQPAADRLARTVTAALRAVRQYVTTDAVLTEVSDLSTRSMPDNTVTLPGGAPQPRAMVTCNLHIHPRSTP